MGSIRILVLAVAAAAASQATTVTLRSGNGTIGSTDSLITFLLGPADTDFNAVLTPSDFLNAQNGPAASIIPHPFWIGALSTDPAAQWIGTNADAGSSNSGTTGLYAESFFLPFDVGSATMTLDFAVDNSLGGFVNTGAFLNGLALNVSGGSFGSDTVINPPLQVG